MMEALIPLYKPVGPTSHDMVDLVRQIAGTRKVGHAGTLDPLASGVLVVGINRGTKQLGTMIKVDKEYRAQIRMGMTSTTDDAEGEKTLQPIKQIPSRARVEKALYQFIGEIYQQPPPYSAIKVRGRAAYSLARKGKEVRLKPRLITIYAIELIRYQWPNLWIKVSCGSGVYIRALARDLGQKLGTGAYLQALERTRVGQYTLDHAVTISQLKEILRADGKKTGMDKAG